MCSAVVQEVIGSNPGPVKSNTELPMARRRCDCFFKRAVLPKCNVRLVYGNGIPMEMFHGTYGTEIDEQEIENLLNERSGSEYECQNDNEL